MTRSCDPVRGAFRRSQLRRFFTLIRILASGQKYSIPDIATRLGCHLKTARRDVELMADAGFPIYVELVELDVERQIWRCTPGKKGPQPTLVPVMVPHVYMEADWIVDYAGPAEPPVGPIMDVSELNSRGKETLQSIHRRVRSVQRSARL